MHTMRRLVLLVIIAPMNRAVPNAPRQRRALAAVLFAVALTACQTTQPTASAYQAESFTVETPFQYYSERGPEAACEIGKRALLSQGYQVEGGQPTNVKGEKHFRPAPTLATRLSITLVCLPSSMGAAVYANAMETSYELKSSGTSAGLSVAGVGSVSMPWAADKDTLVKTGEVTVTAPEFYHRLFELIRTLDG